MERNRTLRSARFGFHEEIPQKPVLRLLTPLPKKENTVKKWAIRALMFAFWLLCVTIILSLGR